MAKKNLLKDLTDLQLLHDACDYVEGALIREKHFLADYKGILKDKAVDDLKKNIQDKKDLINEIQRRLQK